MKNLTGDKQLEREGKVDQASGSAKDKVGDAADSVKDKLKGDKDRPPGTSARSTCRAGEPRSVRGCCARRRPSWHRCHRSGLTCAQSGHRMAPAARGLQAHLPAALRKVVALRHAPAPIMACASMRQSERCDGVRSLRPSEPLSLAR